MKTKLFFFIAMCLFWVHGYTQDINYNTFNNFNNLLDTNQVTWGVRFGKVNLIQPEFIKLRKSTHDDFPKKVGVGNFILDFRTRFARDTISGVGHDALTGMNLSLLRSRVYIGYQYNRSEWFVGVRAGYQVYRIKDGESNSFSKTFTGNIPLVGVEVGVSPNMLDQRFRMRILCEYDFGFLDYFGSGIFTVRAFNSKLGRLDIGIQYDGIWGYGGFMSLTSDKLMLYVSQFAGQILFQETRFPEQRFGMERGYAVGLQVSLK